MQEEYSKYYSLKVSLHDDLLTVDKIYIYENKQIKIQIRYQDVIEKMKIIRRFYTEHQSEYGKEVG